MEKLFVSFLITELVDQLLVSLGLATFAVFVARGLIFLASPIVFLLGLFCSSSDRALG
jgi:hypothetical protein